MGFWDMVKSMFSGGPVSAEGYWIYVRCRRCGEVIKTRLDPRHGLSETDDGSYIARKTLVGNQLCFERIEVTLTFDKRRNLIDRQISRGEFITAADYAAENVE